MPFIEESMEYSSVIGKAALQKWHAKQAEILREAQEAANSQEGQGSPARETNVYCEEGGAYCDEDGRDTESGSGSQQSSVEQSSHKALMQRYRHFFEERGIPLHHVSKQKTVGQADAAAMSRKRKRGKLGMGLPPPTIKTKKEKDDEERARKRKASEDDFRYGPNRHLYAPHLHLLQPPNVAHQDLDDT